MEIGKDGKQQQILLEKRHPEIVRERWPWCVLGQFLGHGGGKGM